MQKRTPKPIPANPDVFIESEKRVWDGRFPLDVVRFRNRRFDGAISNLRTWEVWRRGQAVAMLPYDPQADAVVLIEQLRFPALVAGMDPVLLECPAGLLEDDEAPEPAMARELQEEMGLTAERMEWIGSYILSPGGCDEVVVLYAGQVTAPATDEAGIAGTHGLAEENEDIRVRVLPADEAIAMAMSGKVTNVVTALALFWFAAQRERLRQAWRLG